MGAMLSTLCRQMRHTACVAAGGCAGCPCHYDDEMAGAAEAVAELARNESAGLQSPAAREHAERPPLDPPRIKCREPGCEREFINTHAEAVHRSRAHKPADIPDPEEEVLDEEDEALEDPEIEDVWSPIVQDALAAVAFLEGRDQNDVIHTVMDDWAGRMRTEPDIGDAIRLRNAYREGHLR